MFSKEEFIADCRSALQSASPGKAIKEIAERAVSDPAAAVRALGTPSKAGLIPLYQSDELTILNVVWAPGMSLFPHDHRMWAVIAVYQGREDNAFFKRTAGGLVPAGEKHLDAGDAVLLGARTVHAVTNPLDRLTGALQVYGGDFFKVSRSEFDPVTMQERPFEIERAKAVFLEANKRLPG
ncbi:MAG: metal-dependent protein of the double-stranded beta helix superfamily-like protein [Ramlibacter sp.]|nr:metal-dependent protein of the double-stranded beta helix superfamily-like protein [Ramlibacter sp.]